MNLSRLTNNYDELTALEKKVVEYIMTNPEKVVHLTANELAERLYVSKTTIINLSKKLDFDGFIELRYYVKNYVSKKTENIYQVSYQNMLQSINDEISKTLALQNEETIKKVAERILEAKLVYVIARGASKPIAQLLSSRLAILKIKSILIEDVNLIDAISNSLEPDEVLLLISLSGETQKIRDIAKIARAKNIDVIALTSFSNNTLQRLSNYKMFCFADNPETKYNDLVSRLGLHTLTQLLITYIYAHRKE